MKGNSLAQGLEQRTTANVCTPISPLPARTGDRSLQKEGIG
jgi:hypothetical protein